MVVSDHSPCTPNLKQTEKGDFMAAWGGIAGLQLGMSNKRVIVPSSCVDCSTTSDFLVTIGKNVTFAEQTATISALSCENQQAATEPFYRLEVSFHTFYQHTKWCEDS